MSTLRDRLYHQEATPPARAWERIAAALDESHLANEFPRKLYQQEATPPPAAWNKIKEELDSSGGAPRATVVRMAPRYANFLRYAAAAILIFLAGYFILDWSKRSDDPNSPQELVVNPDTTAPEDGNLAKTPAPKEVNSVTIPALNPSQENLVAENKPGKTASTTRRSNRTFAAANYSNETEAETMYAYSEPRPNLAERYVMFMTPTGKIIRMSRKWGDMVCCVSGEAQDEDCKDQLKQWQEKLATSAATSSGNFMDVMSLVSELENGL